VVSINYIAPINTDKNIQKSLYIIRNRIGMVMASKKELREKENQGRLSMQLSH
jgi:hypothetical protein